MIDENEFERRIHVWFELVMNALGDNVLRMLSEGKPFTADDLDNPTFAFAMHEAAVYQATYLSDDILAYFLDPALPKDYFQNTSRLEFLLQQALLQKSSQLQAAQCIERAMQHT